MRDRGAALGFGKVSLLLLLLLLGLVMGLALGDGKGILPPSLLSSDPMRKDRPQLEQPPPEALQQGSEVVEGANVAEGVSEEVRVGGGGLAPLESLYLRDEGEGGRLLTPAEVFELVEGSVVSITVRVRGLFGFTETQGSGFVFSPEGYIVTNNHVVEGASRIRVTFLDGTVVDAQLVGSDPFSDLAVLKVDLQGSELKPLKLGDSSKLRVGEPIVAIGNPFGLGGSLTFGVISQLGRLLPAPGGFSIPDVIQVDAAINPGNSGGPLLNMKGEVVGVNTAIASDTGLFSGLGFAIPVNTVKRVVPELIEKGEYKHVWLGISSTDMTPELASSLGLREPKGLVVVGVFEDGPAAKAGVKPNDVIVGIDGRPVRKLEDLLIYLERNTSVGDVVELRIIRAGEALNLRVELEERPPP